MASKDLNINVTPFSGEGNAKIWLNKFEKVSKLRKWKEEDKILHFSLALINKAEQWFYSLEEESQNNFDKAVESFQQRFFQSEVSRPKLIRQFLASVQEDGSDVISYIEKVQTLGAELGRSQEEIKDVVVNGLCPDIRKFVLSKEAQSLKEIVKYGKMFESMEQEGTNNTELFNKVAALQQELEELRKQTSSASTHVNIVKTGQSNSKWIQRNQQKRGNPSGIQCRHCGTDFLKTHNAKIDCGKGCLELEGGIAVVGFLQPSQEKSNLARVLNNINISPRSVSTIKVTTSKNCTGINLLEPLSSLPSKLHIMGARSVSTVKKNSTVYQVLNPTNKMVELKAKQPIAMVKQIEQNQIFDDLPLQDGSNKVTPVSSISTKTNNTDSANVQKAKDIGISIENSDLTTEQKNKLLSFLGKNRDVFAKDMSELGTTNLYFHEIDTGEAKPIKQRFYRTSPGAKREIENQTKEMLDNDIIEEANTPWQSPVVLVKKASGEYRFAIDYRKVNQVTKPISFPIPRFEDISDTIGQAKAKFYSSLD
ncbi:uncharacterized protein [Argopecten irradians]|uniref:uncharacterized protein n=1 Tax=Argopecten irradians TaxID=31199 RepID=UPI0037152AE0